MGGCMEWTDLPLLSAAGAQESFARDEGIELSGARSCRAMWAMMSVRLNFTLSAIIGICVDIYFKHFWLLYGD